MKIYDNQKNDLFFLNHYLLILILHFLRTISFFTAYLQLHVNIAAIRRNDIIESKMKAVNAAANECIQKEILIKNRAEVV